MTEKSQAGSRKPEARGGGREFVLHAEGVSFAYGKQRVVDGVSLKLAAGEVLAIVGPNGCGKSTLLKLLCGQLQPQAGAVRVGDEGGAMAGMTPAAIARQIALVPQSSAVGFDYSVRQIVLMARWPAHARSGGGGVALTLGFETAADQRIADRAMWAMDVHYLADRPITELSGGERQRVIVARALAQETPAILLDEPATALDLWHQLELFDHLQRLARAERKAILMVTHDLNHALAYADRVVVMDAGRIVAEGPPCLVLTPATLEPVYRVAVQTGSATVLTFKKRAV